MFVVHEEILNKHTHWCQLEYFKRMYACASIKISVEFILKSAFINSVYSPTRIVLLLMVMQPDKLGCLL